MPMYDFICKKCSKQEVHFLTINSRDKLIRCSCGDNLIRIMSIPSTCRVYSSTFWSQSMAISPDQIGEHEKLFPNVKVRADGCVGFDSVKEHVDYCKKVGFEKMPQKCKGRGKKI